SRLAAAARRRRDALLPRASPRSPLAAAAPRGTARAASSVGADARDGLLPAGVEPLAAARVEARRERPVDLLERGDVGERLPEAARDPGEIRGPRGGRLDVLRTDHGDPEDVRLELH